MLLDGPVGAVRRMSLSLSMFARFTERRSFPYSTMNALNMFIKTCMAGLWRTILWNYQHTKIKRLGAGHLFDGSLFFLF